VVASLQWPHATAEQVARDYRLIAGGLRATANRGLGRFDAEADALRARRAILNDVLKDSGRIEVAREAMLTEAQLAVNAHQRSDVAGVHEWLGKALARADDVRARANGVSDREQLDVLWLAAELTVAIGESVVPDLPKRLEAAQAELVARREPRLRSYARWFEIYATLVGPGKPGGERAP
jgi:hypothetical protein